MNNLPITTEELNNVQKGWLVMASLKETTFQSLGKKELEVQGFLNDIDKDKDLKSVQDKLSKAKSLASEAKEERLHFTNKLKEKLIDKAMEFEKRNDDLIIKASKHEFTLREAEVEKNKEVDKKNKEISNFKLHFENGNYKIASDYRLTLSNRINFYYKGAMTQKKMSKKDLEQYIQDIKNELPQIEVGKHSSFERNLITKEEAIELFKSVQLYNPANDLKEAIENVDIKFGMYEQDIKNAEAAIKQSEIDAKKKEEDEKEALKVEQSTNTLIAAAGSFTVLGGAVIKKALEVEEENTTEWAMSVIAAFIKNMARCKLRVQTWSKLSIGQMAAALGKLATDTGETFAGLKLKEIKK